MVDNQTKISEQDIKLIVYSYDLGKVITVRTFYFGIYSLKENIWKIKIV